MGVVSEDVWNYIRCWQLARVGPIKCCVREINCCGVPSTQAFMATPTVSADVFFADYLTKICLKFRFFDALPLHALQCHGGIPSAAFSRINISLDLTLRQDL